MLLLTDHYQSGRTSKVQSPNESAPTKEKPHSQKSHVTFALNPAFLFKPQTAPLNLSCLLLAQTDSLSLVCAFGVHKVPCFGFMYITFNLAILTANQQLTLSQTTSSTYLKRYRYTFPRTRDAVPDTNWVLLAIYELDYAINSINGMQGYLLSYDLTVQSITTNNIEIGLEFSHQIISNLKISMLIILNNFPYKDIFSIETFHRYRSSTATSGTFTISPAKTPYEYLPFITQAMIKTKFNSRNRIQISWTFDSLLNKFTSCAYSNDDYSAENFTAKILLIYKDYAQTTYPLTIEVYSPSQNNNSDFQAPFNSYGDGKSVFFAGLTSFQFRADYDDPNNAIKWTINKLLSTEQPLLKFTLSLDSQFNMFQFSFFTLSRKKCPQTHAFRGQNSSNDTVCFDQCRQDQYLVYNSTYKSLICTDCNMSHCKTCVAVGKCNSCFDGYTFDSVNYNCTLSPGYCLNSQNQSQKCGDAMVNCINCSSNTTCTICQHGFFLNTSHLCSPCSNLTADCTLCNSTHCVNCELPKVLINASLCDLPKDSQPLPTPNGVSGTCQDPNCITCQTGNSSICLRCSSALYQLQNDRCVVLCGDGIIFGTDVCDDGNKISFDGCSADCQTLEIGFVCNSIPSQMPGFDKSECYLNRTVMLTVASIEKSLNENKVNLYFKNPEPMVSAWQEMELNNQLTKAFTLKIPRFDSGVSGYFFNYTASFVKSPEAIGKLRLRSKNLSPQETYSQKLLSRNLQSQTASPIFLPEHYEFIMLEVLYSLDAPGEVPQPEIFKESLNQQTMSLTFDPKTSQRSIFTKNQSPLLFASSFTLKADDNQVIQFYDQSYYQKLGLIEILSKAIGFSCILLVVIGLVSFCVDGRNSKQILVAIETSFVVQLTYFALLGLGEINPMFLNMASGLKFSTGYDLMLGDEGSHAFRELSGMGVGSAEMTSNVNLSFMLVLSCQIVGAVFLFLDKFVKKQQKSQIQNQETQVDELVDSSKKIKDDSEEASKTASSAEQESTSKKIGMFLIFNAGFGLFLFFLYKFMFFSMIQLKYGLNSFKVPDIIVLGFTVIMLLFYTVCLVKKLEWFDSFILKLQLRQPKINIMETLAKNKVMDPQKIKKIEARFLNYVKELPDNQKPEDLRAVELSVGQINIKLWYLIIFLVEHSINMAVAVFLGPLTASNRISSVVIYILSLIFVCKYSPYPASSLYRVYFTYFIGGIVQSLLFIRAMILAFGSETQVGRTESSLGVYFPFSIVALLLLLCAVGLVYSVYGIRKVRCCKLEMDWQKIGLTGIMKLKLEAFILEELNGKYHQSNYSYDDCEKGYEEDGDQLMGKLEEESYGSKNDGQAIKRQTCNTGNTYGKQMSNTGGKAHNGKQPFSGHQMMRGRRHRIQVEELDVKINQEITTRAIKKEIKEKMLTNKLNHKIQEREKLKLEGTDRPFKKHLTFFEANQNITAKEGENGQKEEQNDEKGDQSEAIMLKESIGKVYFEQVKLRQEEGNGKTKTDSEAKPQKETYLYTDKQQYNVYEEFDMI